MVWWIGTILIACDLGLAVVLTPLRMKLSVQGRGETGGVWAAGGAVQVGPVAVSAAAGRGAPTGLQLYAWRWRLWQRPVAKLLGSPGKQDGGPREQAQDLARRVAQGYRRFERWFDPFDAARFMLGERRRIRPSRLEVDLDYSFDDVVLTGRILAAIYVLRSALPPQVVVREKHSWESVDRLHGAIEGEIEIWPVLLGIDVLWYVVRGIKIRQRSSAAGGATEST